jgi:hypothetical protein
MFVLVRYSYDSKRKLTVKYSSESKSKLLYVNGLSVRQSVDNITISPYPFDRFNSNFVYNLHLRIQ